jgi:uncharacterized protein (UPF0248 family)
MAQDTAIIDDLVARLTKQLGCELLTYNPTTSSSVRPGPQRHLFPAGPYALGLSHTGDETHIVCLTDNTSNTFWEYIAEKLDREDLPKHDCIISTPGHEATVWLHYCSLPPHFDLATVGAYGFPKYPESTFVPQAARNNLALLQDTWYLLDCLGEDLNGFRHDYNVLRRWAEAAGIFSNDAFGTLDAESLVWMLLYTNSVTTDSTAERQSTPSPGKHSILDRRSAQPILTPSGRLVHVPPPHIAANSYATINSEIDQLSQNTYLVSLSAAQHYQRFCENFRTTILVSAECWAAGHQREAFHSRLLNQITHLAKHLLEDLGSLEQQDLRFWPYAFRPSQDEWLYVIGVNCSPAALENFVANSHLLDLDSSLGTVTLTICPKDMALSLPIKHSTPETPSWPAELYDTRASPQPPSPPSNTAATSPSSKHRFPPAAQVLSRLRWDPAHRPFDYEVGYVDRFTEGLMWLPMELWGRETEEEDFIPEHRIRVFRRAGRDGGENVVVWDREKRVCTL